jgi:hypothetical protein
MWKSGKLVDSATIRRAAIYDLVPRIPEFHIGILFCWVRVPGEGIRFPRLNDFFNR